MNKNHKLTIFSILPFSEESQLVNKESKQKFLYLLDTIISFSIDGLEAFSEKNFTQFDAQIGENLCQIRAYQVTWLAKKVFSNDKDQAVLLNVWQQLVNYKNLIEETIANWDSVLKKASNYNKSLDGTELAKYFLSRHSLYIELDKDIVLLISCYVLAQFSVKKNNILQSVCLNNVALKLGISKSQSKKLIQNFQTIVCKLGCEFINDIAHELPDKSHYPKIIPNLLMTSDDKRLVLPCFIVSDIIFQHAQRAKIPVFLSIQRIGAQIPEDVVYFIMIGDHIINPVLELYPCYLSSPCMVIEAEVHYGESDEIEAIADYTRRLVKINPIKSLLANTAMHPQYPGENLQLFKDNPFSVLKNENSNLAESSFIDMREFAIAFGCHKENATTLFMKHAYSSTIKTQIQSIHKKNHVHDAYQILNTVVHETYSINSHLSSGPKEASLAQIN